MAAKKRKAAPLFLDQLGHVRKALRVLKRLERFMVAQERRTEVQMQRHAERHAKRCVLTPKGEAILNSSELAGQA